MVQKSGIHQLIVCKCLNVPLFTVVFYLQPVVVGLQIINPNHRHCSHQHQQGSKEEAAHLPTGRFTPKGLMAYPKFTNLGENRDLKRFVTVKCGDIHYVQELILCRVMYHSIQRGMLTPTRITRDVCSSVPGFLSFSLAKSKVLKSHRVIIVHPWLSSMVCRIRLLETNSGPNLKTSLHHCIVTSLHEIFLTVSVS